MGTLRPPVVLLEHILFKTCKDVTLSKRSCHVRLSPAEQLISANHSQRCSDTGIAVTQYCFFSHLMIVRVLINIHTSIATSYSDLHGHKTVDTVAASDLMNEGQNEAEVQRPQLQGSIKAGLIC